MLELIVASVRTIVTFASPALLSAFTESNGFLSVKKFKYLKIEKKLHSIIRMDQKHKQKYIFKYYKI